MYQQLTKERRYTLMSLMKAGYKQKDICRVLGCHRSTIYRELKRNTKSKRYSAIEAEKLKNSRRADNRPPGRLTADIKVRINHYLRQKWSPEQIAGYCRKEGLEMVSYESIYKYIYSQPRSLKLYKELRRRGRKRKKRSSLKPRRQVYDSKPQIKNRPTEVDEKQRIGDWEGDLIVGAHQTGYLVTLVERKTKYTLIGYVKRNNSKAVTREIVKLFKTVPSDQRETLTLDNGPEFAQHKNIRKRSLLDVFYANPYCSWERGLNENTNGLIRQYFPKRSKFNHITKEDIKGVQKALNERPRKTLDYNSPIKVFIKNKNVALET